MTAAADRFRGKTAVVTGAASGIGRAIAERLVAEGANVVGTDINADLLAEVASALGAPFTACAGDVTREADAEALVATAVEMHGSCDMAFNVAGGNRGHLRDHRLTRRAIA